VPNAIDGATDVLNPAGDAGGGFVVHDAHRLDCVTRVGAQPLLDLASRHTLAPVAGQEVHDELQPLGELLPQRRELAGLGHQHAIAGRQRVDQRRLPRAGATRGIDDDVLFRLEHLLHPGEHGLAEPAELGAAMIDRGVVDRAQHAVRNVRRPGDLQEMATGVMAVEFEHGGWPGGPIWYTKRILTKSCSWPQAAQAIPTRHDYPSLRGKMRPPGRRLTGLAFFLYA